MTGILSYGAYVPPTRIGFSTLAGRPARPDDTGPERAVAWSDEDSVTMGVAAALNCLRGFDRASVDAIAFASTTHPFLEKQTAALVAKVLDLRRDVATSDHAGSLRAGTTALRAAADAVASGSARRVLVIASDCRLAAPGSALERSFGDGAAAFLVGDGDAIATFAGSHAVADEIVDVWRSQEDRFVHSWEERFVVQEGLLPNLIEAVRGLVAKLPAAPAVATRAALYAPDERSHASLARALRLAPGAGAGPAVRKARQHRRGVRADAARRRAREGPARRAPARRELRRRRRGARAGRHPPDREARAPPRRLLAPRAPARRAQPRALPARARPRRARVHAGARRRPLGDHPLSRARLGSLLQGPALPRLRGRAVPDPARVRDLLPQGRFRAAAALGSRGSRRHLHARLLLPDPRAADDRDDHRDRRRAGPPPARRHASPTQVHPGLAVTPMFRRIHEVGGRPNYYWKAAPLPEGDA